jgi:hypothetical protein
MALISLTSKGGRSVREKRKGATFKTEDKTNVKIS